MHQQPKALRILFLTEMWEQYGFFTLQSLLIFYLIKKLSLSDGDAYTFSGQFAALVYLTPLIGGWIADRFLGLRAAILLGGSLLSAGYALLALGPHTFFVGLSLIIMGNGLFKPNLSNFLGEFYSQNDSRREAGFTLFYVGANIGSLIAISGGGYIQKYVGWGACFAIASCLLFFGMCLFGKRFSNFSFKNFIQALLLKTDIIFLRKNLIVILGFCFSFVVIYYALTVIGLGNYGLSICGLLFCIYVSKLAWKLDSRARQHILALMLLFIISIFYKAMFFETYFAVNVFTDRVVDRSVFGYEIPATVFLALGSFFSILLGPFWARLWQSKKYNCSIPLKFALSILIIGGCLQLLAWLTMTNSILSAVWILVFRFFFTISELFILPIGLSMVTEYAPKNCAGIMMGGWCISAAFGGKLSGILAHSAAVPVGITDLHQLNSIYHHAFQHYAILSFIIFPFCLLLTPMINKLLNNELENEKEIPNHEIKNYSSTI